MQTRAFVEARPDNDCYYLALVDGKMTVYVLWFGRGVRGHSAGHAVEVLLGTAKSTGGITGGKLPNKKRMDTIYKVQANRFNKMGAADNCKCRSQFPMQLDCRGQTSAAQPELNYYNIVIEVNYYIILYYYDYYSYYNYYKYSNYYNCYD